MIASQSQKGIMHIGGMRSTFALLAIHVAPMHSLLGIGGLARRVRRLPVATARVERVQTFWCRDDDDSPLAGRLEAMLEMSPSLQRPRYRPSVRSSKANFMVATLRSRLGALRRSMEPPLLNRTSECGDPDLTVEWVKDEVGASLPPNAPIVIFLHTITGTAAQTRWLMAYASTRGWRSCVFVRRGHSHRRLSSPTFNLMGAVEDVNVQLATVQAAYPAAAFLGMVGISAGSAQLISYLGRAGHASPVGAACAICPAWNVRICICICICCPACNVRAACRLPPAAHLPPIVHLSQLHRLHMHMHIHMHRSPQPSLRSASLSLSQSAQCSRTSKRRAAPPLATSPLRIPQRLLCSSGSILWIYPLRSVL